MTPYQAFRGQQIHLSSVTASPETVEGMLENLGKMTTYAVSPE